MDLICCTYFRERFVCFAQGLVFMALAGCLFSDDWFIKTTREGNLERRRIGFIDVCFYSLGLAKRNDVDPANYVKYIDIIPKIRKRLLGTF